MADSNYNLSSLEINFPIGKMDGYSSRPYSTFADDDKLSKLWLMQAQGLTLGLTGYGIIENQPDAFGQVPACHMS